MKLGKRFSTIATIVLVAFAAVTVTPTAVLASTEGRQNTALVLAAAAIAAAIMVNKAPAYGWNRQADVRSYQGYNRYDRGDNRDYRTGDNRGYDRNYQSGDRRSSGTARYDTPRRSSATRYARQR